MNWHLPKFAFLLFSLTTVAGHVQASLQQTSQRPGVSELCHPAIADGALNAACVRFMHGYFLGLQAQQRPSPGADSASEFEQRALKTRAGGYFKHRLQAHNSYGCMLDQQAQLEQMADSFGYLGATREAFIRSVKLALPAAAYC